MKCSIDYPCRLCVALVLALLTTPGQAQDNIRDQLNRVENQLQSTTDRKLVEELVGKSFQLRMKLQEQRIQELESDLARIKDEHKRRMQNADQMIARRVAELAVGKPANDENEDVAAAILAQEGWQAWRKQDWRTALAKFKAAFDKSPGDSETLNGLGWTHLHLREFSEAIKYFELTLKEVPNHGGALNGLGRAQMATGQLDQAEKTLLTGTEAVIEAHGEATTVKNNMTAAWLGLIDVLIRQKKYEDAEKWAMRYLKHKPDEAMVQDRLDRIKQQR